MKKYYIAFFAIAAALAITPAALADTVSFDVNFSGSGSGSGISGSGVITANLVSPGLYEITNITGNFTDTHTGVSGAITDPFPASLSRETSPDDLWYYDNLLYISAGNQFIDGWGWLFDVGTSEVEIWGNGIGSGYTEMVSLDEIGYPNWGENADVTVTPEPASLLLLGTGLLGLAFLAFRKAKASGMGMVLHS